MLKIEKIDTNNKTLVKRFVRIPYRLYANHPQWVPPLFMDAETQLNRTKHPFFEHSDADFFIASKDGLDVGRIAALENKRFNEYHKTKQAQFYLFDCVDDQEVANTLFDRVFDWAKNRGLDTIVGPKGFGALDGYGIQVEGFEHRQMMTMMNYNYPYYVNLVENLGFTKEVDFVSCYLGKDELIAIAKEIKGAKKFILQNFNPKDTLCDNLVDVQPYTDMEMDEFKRAIEKYVEFSKVR